MDKSFEDIIYKIHIFTKLSEKEIVDKIQSLSCSYSDAAQFASITGRLPTPPEAHWLKANLILYRHYCYQRSHMDWVKTYPHF